MDQARMKFPIQLLRQTCKSNLALSNVPDHSKDIFVKDICETFASGVDGNAKIMDKFFTMLHNQTRDFYFIPSMALSAYLINQSRSKSGNKNNKKIKAGKRMNYYEDCSKKGRRNNTRKIPVDSRMIFLQVYIDSPCKHLHLL